MQTNGANLKPVGFKKRRLNRLLTLIPPNRLETNNRELLATLLRIPKRSSLDYLRDMIRLITGRQHIFFAPSCRAAIAQVLALLPNREVVLPAYTCPVVKNAAQIAGKKIVYVDIAKDNLNSTSSEFALEARAERIFIPTHVFGLPTDIESINQLARANNCITVEDAAASFGAQLNGKLLGTIGDIGVFSFERSKRFPAFHGAIIIINNENILEPDLLRTHKLIETQYRFPIKELFFAIIYNIATIPWIYGRITVPFLLNRYNRKGNITDSENPDAEKSGAFYTNEFHSYQASLVLRMLKRMDMIRSKIREIVSIYRKILEGSSIKTFTSPLCDDAGLLRFPIAFPGRAREEIIQKALNRGLYLETNYERPLPPENEWSQFPNATWAAHNVILLPLYTRLALSDAERIAQEIKRL